MPQDPRLLRMAETPSEPPIFERIAIVGIGLIGGSLALAARRAWPAALVIGVDRHEVLEQAMVRHAVDVGSPDLALISGADLVVLAAPVRENLRLVAELPERIPGEAVVTDVGSTKSGIVEASRALPRRLRFVGGHPLAGMPRGGFENARADIFTKRPWILTPDAPADDDSRAVTARLSAFVTALGATPVELPAAAHDEVVAFISHLPQLVAAALMAVVGEAAGEWLHLGGRGLLDTTRLAAAPASAWRDVCYTNAEQIGPALDRLIALLQELRAGLASDAAVDGLFARANAWRARLSPDA